MDLDRTSLGERTPDLRARSQPTQDPKQKADDSAMPPVAPEHGGALASSQTDRESELRRDPDDDQRRQNALDSVARFLSLPGDAELEIEVENQNPDDEQSKVTFLLRNRRTGEVIRTVPEDESGQLVEQLRKYHGAIVDRSF